MLLGASFLTIDQNRMSELLNSNADFIHVDVMDGEFVPNTTDLFYRVQNKLRENQKMLDVHLMVRDVKKYIMEYANLRPAYITFHYEAVKDHMEIINILRKMNIKIGIAINPGTDMDSILSYLDCIDMVLIMSVIPGAGGQKFLDATLSKIKRLNLIREINNLDFKIEVDGGINKENVSKLINVDYVICGNAITSGDDFNKEIEKIKDNFPLRD